MNPQIQAKLRPMQKVPTSQTLFHKLSATGNDFILVDLCSPPNRQNWLSEFEPLSKSSCATRLCSRHEGIGADGLIILEDDADTDFRWDFYNSDGSSARMCGNAARAVGLYGNLQYGLTQTRIQTAVGLLTVETPSFDHIVASMPTAPTAEWDLMAESIKYDFVDSGVPHAIVATSPSSFDNSQELRRLALAIKAQARHKPVGTNVTFVQHISPDHIKAKTFERGVENFTLSCGTGAIAAAYWLNRGISQSPIRVEVPGGNLQVRWTKDRTQLIGPARYIATFQFVI